MMRQMQPVTPEAGQGGAEQEVCLLIPSLSGGGAERVCLLLANQWASLGRVVRLIVMKAEGPFLGRLDPRLKLVVLGHARARQVPREVARVLEAIPGVPVLVFGFELGVVVSLLKMLRVVANPVVYREGNDPRAYIGATRRWLYPAAIRWADGVLAQGRYVRICLRALTLDSLPIVTIPNPMAVDAMSSPLSEARPAPGLRLVAAGRLAPQKGFDRLLQGFARMVGGRPQASLVIAGLGPEQDRLEQLATRLGIGDRVTFAGFVDNMGDYFQQADLFVLSSHFEGQPNALLEAILAGTRVLAAGGEPVRELMETLGLPECWISDADFGTQFSVKMKIVLSLPPERWQAAANRLAALTELSTVASVYWQFVHSLHPSRPII